MRRHASFCCFLLLLTQFSYAFSDNLEHFKQLASFDLAGKVEDEHGKPLDDVTFEVTLYRFDPIHLASNSEVIVVKRDKAFNFSYKDISGIEIKASKSNYCSDSFYKHYGELFDERRSELGQKVRSGEIQQKAVNSNPRAYYRDLKYRNENMKLCLIKEEGSKAQMEDVSLLNVVGDKPIAKACVQYKQADKYIKEEVLNLEMQNDDQGTAKRLILSCPKGGGIIINKKQVPFNHVMRAPTKGYLQQVDISELPKDVNFSLFLKTPKGYYAKGEANTYFLRQKKRGALSIYKFAIQVDGSNSLCTD